MLFILFILSVNVIAQPRLERNFSHQLYTTYDGLAQSQVNCMMQDSKGYIWIGTKGGLSRWDGEKFINFIDENDGSRINVIGIIEMEDGLILNSPSKFWKFSYEEEKPENWSFQDLEGLSNFRFIYYKNNLFNANDSCLYLFNCVKDGNYEYFYQIRYNLKSKKCDVLYSGDNKVLYSKIEQDDCLFFTSDTLCIFNHTGLHKQALPGKFTCYVENQSDSTTYGISETDNKIYKLDPLFSSATLIMKNTKINLNFRLIADLANNNSLYFVNKQNEICKLGCGPLGRNTIISCMLIDRENNLWVGTENGIYNYFKAGFEEHKFNIGKSVDNVWSIIQTADSTMWFGGYLTGFWSLDKKDRLTVYNANTYLDNELQEYNNTFYMGGITDKEGRAYLPVKHGILRIENNKIKHFRIDKYNVPMSITDDPGNNRLLMGTSAGFCVMEKGTMKIIDLVRSPRSIVSTCIDKKGNILAGSFTAQFIYQQDTLIPYHPERNRGAISMVKDFRGNVWKGTSTGLYLDNGDDESQQFDEKIKGMIASVHISHPYLLAATVNRLYMVNLDSFYNNPNALLYEFDPGNGYIAMDGGQNGFYTDNEGYVWYTVTDKVLRFSPEDLAQSYFRHSPKPHFVSFNFSSDQVSWNRVEPHDTLNLKRKWNENSVRFNINAVSATYADNMVYQYRIKQLSPEWSEPTQITQQTFSNLRPGKYQIEIRCSCHDGVWSDVVTSPLITIKRAWWQFWWVGLLMALMIIGLIIRLTVLIVKQRQKYLIRKLNEQKRLNELRLQTVRSKHIPHFSGNALSNIEHFIFSADLRQANKYLTKYSRLMNIMLRDADKASRSIEQEIEYVTLYLELEKMRFEDKLEYEIQLQPDIDTRKEIPNMLLQTWVENALKHGLRHKDGVGKITIIIKNSTGYTEISVEDNGIGREKAKELGTTGTGQGLKILAEQIEIYNHFNKSKIEIRTLDLSDENRKATGTRFIIFIPDNYNFTSLEN